VKLAKKKCEQKEILERVHPLAFVTFCENNIGLINLVNEIFVIFQTYIYQQNNSIKYLGTLL
jgi:hypothetical protein